MKFLILMFLFSFSTLHADNSAVPYEVYDANLKYDLCRDVLFHNDQSMMIEMTAHACAENGRVFLSVDSDNKVMLFLRLFKDSMADYCTGEKVGDKIIIESCEIF